MVRVTDERVNEMTDEELNKTLIARLRQHDGWVTLEAHAHLTAADRIEALQKALKDQSSVSDRLAEQLAAAQKDAEEAEAYAVELEKGRDVASIWNEAVDEALDILDDEGWLGESRERIELLKKPIGGKYE